MSDFNLIETLKQPYSFETDHLKLWFNVHSCVQ